MTGDTSRLAQARAVVLAALMVGSVLALGGAGTVAAATDAQFGTSGTQDPTGTPDEGTTGTLHAEITNEDLSTFQTVEIDFSGASDFDGDFSSVEDGDVTIFVNGADTGTASVDQTSNGGATITVSLDSSQGISSSAEITVQLANNVEFPSTDGDYQGTISLNPSSSGNSATGTLTVANTDSSVSDGPVENVDTGETFDTIQNAIDDSNTDAGDTIEVDAASGPYNEQVVVNEDIRLVSVNGQATISYAEDNNNAALEVNADGAIVSGFEVVRDPGSSSTYAQSVKISSASDVLVTDNLLTTTNRQDASAPAAVGGLAIEAKSKTSNVTIRNNVVSDSGQGIYTDVEDVILKDVTVEGNDVQSVASGQPEFKLFTSDGNGDIQDLNGEDSSNAQVQAVLSDNDGIDTTNPYGISLNLEQVTVGNTATVEAEILGRDSTDPRKSSVAYRVIDAKNDTDDDVNDGDIVTSSSTSSNSFSTLVEFSEVGDYSVQLPNEPADPDAAGTISNQYSTVEATISSLYAIDNFQVTPSSPQFEDSVTISGQVVNGAGEGVDVGSIKLVDPSGSTTGDSTTTTSDGSFQFSATVGDAGTFGVGTSSSEVFEEFSVGSKQANVTLETAGSNNAGFSETYTVTVLDDDDNPFSVSNVGSGGSDATFDNLNGYVNVSSTFDGSISVSTGEQIASGSNDNYFHLVPNADGVIEFEATPTADSAAVTATLENGDNDGLEETDINSPESPDYVGSDDVAINSAGDLNVQVSTGAGDDDGSIDANSPEDISVTVRGSDGEAPDGTTDDPADANENQAGESALSNATVTLSGPGIDEEDTLGDDEATNPLTFTDVEANQAGTVTVDITAVADDGTEYTETLTVDVTGDKVVSVSPDEVSIDTTGGLTVEVANANDQAVNNREVVVTSDDGAELTLSDGSSDVTTSTLVIDGAAGHIATGQSGSNIIVSDVTINNGVYTASDVTFATPGTLDVEVDRDTSGTSDTSATVSEAVTITGVDAYDITADKEPLVAGTQETVNFTVTENGTAVNGTELSDLVSQFEVTQEDSSVATSVSTANTTGDSSVDVIQAEVTPTAVDKQVNLTITGARAGSGAVDVAAPEVTTNVTADTLTERLTTSVQVDVTNPRTGEPIPDAELQISAANGTVEVAGDEITNAEADAGTESTTVTADSIPDSNTTFRVLGYDGDNDDFAVELAATSDSGVGYFGTTTLDVEPMDVTVSPESIALGNEETLTVSVNDANGDAVVGQRVDISGAGVDISDAATSSTGAVNVLVNPQASGSIDVFVDSDAEVYDTNDDSDNLAPQSEDFDDGALEASVDVEVNPDFGINAGSLTPSTVSDNQTVTHTLTFSVDAMSNDGNSDTFTVTLPSSVEISNVNGATITDANGDEIAISSGPSVTDANGGTNNALTFGIQPDSAFDTSTVSVEANVDVAFPDVSSETTGDVNVTVADSTAGTTGPTTVATVTIQNQSTQVGGDADVNNDGVVDSTDAVLVERALIGLEDLGGEADVDGDGDVDSADAVAVRRAIIGLS